MKSQWRWFLVGVAAAVGLGVLAIVFVAYQRPELLLDLANLRYCG